MVETKARSAVPGHVSAQDEVNNELEPGLFLPVGARGRVFNDHLFGLACIFAFLVILLIVGISRAR